MPDLTTETVWTCNTNTYWEVEVVGSRGDKYRVSHQRNHDPEAQVMYSWRCTCVGFSYRGHCRHTYTVAGSGLRCGWNEGLEPGLEAPGGVCPGCGGPVTAIQVGV
jgi:hypothetical protein